MSCKFSCSGGEFAHCSSDILVGMFGIYHGFTRDQTDYFSECLISKSAQTSTTVRDK